MNPDENATASHEGNPAMLVRPRSSRVRLSGIEAMVNAIDGRASIRAEYRKSLRMSQRSLSSASLSVPNHLDAAEDEDDDAAPSEDEKTMTVWSGALVLSQSMLGGGGRSLLLNFISARLCRSLWLPRTVRFGLRRRSIWPRAGSRVHGDFLFSYIVVPECAGNAGS